MREDIIERGIRTYGCFQRVWFSDGGDLTLMKDRQLVAKPIRFVHVVRCN
jgi:hypothetical protein